eukprot:1154318-Pelagomonas_calceolata.AAC.7
MLGPTYAGSILETPVFWGGVVQLWHSYVHVLPCLMLFLIRCPGCLFIVYLFQFASSSLRLHFSDTPSIYALSGFNLLPLLCAHIPHTPQPPLYGLAVSVYFSP